MEELRCPFSKKLMTNPVVAQNGKTYELSALCEQSFKNDGVLGNYLVDPTRCFPNKEALANIEKIVPTLETKDQKEWKKRRTEVLSAEKIDAKEYAAQGALKEAAELGHKKSKVVLAKQKLAENKSAEALAILSTIPEKERNIEVWDLLGDVYALADDIDNTRICYHKAGKSSHCGALWKLSEFFYQRDRFSDAFVSSSVAVKVEGLWGKANHIRRIADFYRDGTAVKKDMKKANEWYKKLAACGDADAIYYFAEECVENEDFVGCVRKLVSASKKGHEEASSKLEQVHDFLIDLFPAKRRSDSVA